MALDRIIRRQYKFHKSQLGFQRSKRNGTRPTLRQQGHGCVAVLDLKAAYDTVPRDILARRIRKVLDPNVAEIGNAIPESDQ